MRSSETGSPPRIDLQNDRRARARASGATELLAAYAETELLLPSVALGEYLEGFDDPSSKEARALVAPLTVLDVTADVAAVYAAVVRSRRTRGKLIGTNDLWIGCTARVAGVAIVTRDGAHFRRIPDLHVVEYGMHR